MRSRLNERASAARGTNTPTSRSSKNVCSRPITNPSSALQRCSNLEPLNSTDASSIHTFLVLPSIITTCRCRPGRFFHSPRCCAKTPRASCIAWCAAAARTNWRWRTPGDHLRSGRLRCVLGDPTTGSSKRTRAVRK